MSPRGDTAPRRAALVLLVASLASAMPAHAGPPALGEHWYENPLGFSPLELHARNGFLLPAVAVGLTLILTGRNPSLTDRLSFFEEAGPSWGYEFPHTTLYQNNLGLSYRLRSWLSAGMDLSVYLPRDDFNHTTGVAVRPFARFYPLTRVGWRLYFESGGGLIHFSENFPRPTPEDSRLGTKWNGTTKYAVGAEVGLGPKAALLLGVRHVHVSNGNAEGVERNPSHDSNGFFVGIGLRRVVK